MRTAARSVTGERPAVGVIRERHDPEGLAAGDDRQGHERRGLVALAPRGQSRHARRVAYEQRFLRGKHPADDARSRRDSDVPDALARVSVGRGHGDGGFLGLIDGKAGQTRIRGARRRIDDELVERALAAQLAQPPGKLVGGRPRSRHVCGRLVGRPSGAAPWRLSRPIAAATRRPRRCSSRPGSSTQRLRGEPLVQRDRRPAGAVVARQRAEAGARDRV